ncbi:transposase [Streptomyces sp. NPDC059785]|uniref:transposase n=1 Tax=Streptomyces sp. NPDC059785 TaxID=3346945 RepID=UPI00366086C0
MRPADGQALTMTAPYRSSVHYQAFLQQLEGANPVGTLVVVTDNASSHNSKSTREWLAGHPRIQHTFIPVGACWLNLQEGWWRLFRKAALAGQSFADTDEIDQATRVATTQLNTSARPRIWGRPKPPTRTMRRRFEYRL